MIETVQTACGICHQISIGETPVPACIYVDHRNNEYADELLAAAKLLDAAPDLLAACEKFAKDYIDAPGDAKLEDNPLGDVYEAVLAAIEKAIGPE